MSRESEIATLLEANAPLMAIVTGGVHRYEETGEDGITRDSTPDAFEGSNGWLQPCILVKQRGNIPDGWLRDFNSQTESANQVVEVKFYQDKGAYDQIDLARAQVRTLLMGEFLASSYELYIGNEIDRTHDNGALNGASLAQQDWVIPNIIGG